VKSVRRCAKYVLERVAGVEFERLGRKSMLIADPANPEQAWCSLRATLRGVLKRHRIDHVIDVGANTGQFGKFMRSIYSGRMSSFEPVSSAFAKLQQAIGDDANWAAYQIALGSHAEVANIHVAPMSGFSSFLQTNDYCVTTFGEQTAGAREESVRIRRLDDVLEEISKHHKDERIFLKMDTQGFDLEVFRGLGGKLPRVVALQSEVSLVPIYEHMPRWTECIVAFEQAGFGIAGMFPVSRVQGRVIEYDCVLTRI
jgi:FkbM family methyltransferase